MDFIFDQVVQLEHGHHTHGDRLVVGLARLAIPQDLFAQHGHRYPGFFHRLMRHLDNILMEDVCRYFAAEFLQPEGAANGDRM